MRELIVNGTTQAIDKIKPPADQRRAQRKAVTRRARHGKNAEAFLNP